VDRDRRATEDGIAGVSIRVLIADDQELVRTGLRMILEAQPDIEVVGEAADGQQAVELARSLRPDVCLFDIRMPSVDGVAATRTLAGPGVADPLAVVVITTFDLDEYVFAALRAGARGFLLKDAGPELLGQAIRAAARGDALIAPNVTVRLLEAFTAAAPAPPPAQPIEPLTAREEEVHAAVASGRSNAEIASELHISLGTVKTHLATLMSKLEARNRVELAIWAHATKRIPRPVGAEGARPPRT
jgi:DNA-binding NarL/FixJ family response regulator